MKEITYYVNYVEQYIKSNAAHEQFKDDLIQEAYLADMEGRDIEQALKDWLKKFA